MIPSGQVPQPSARCTSKERGRDCKSHNELVESNSRWWSIDARCSPQLVERQLHQKDLHRLQVVERLDTELAWSRFTSSQSRWADAMVHKQVQLQSDMLGESILLRSLDLALDSTIIIDAVLFVETIFHWQSSV